MTLCCPAGLGHPYAKNDPCGHLRVLSIHPALDARRAGGRSHHAEPPLLPPPTPCFWWLTAAKTVRSTMIFKATYAVQPVDRPVHVEVSTSDMITLDARRRFE